MFNVIYYYWIKDIRKRFKLMII